MSLRASVAMQFRLVRHTDEDSEARGSEMKTVTNNAINQDAVNALVELSRKGGGYFEREDVEQIMRRFGIGGAGPASVSPADRREAVASRIQVQTTHQKAIDALLEMSLNLCGLDAPRTYPQSQVPALFRAAIKEQKTSRRNPYPQETAILETALAMFEHATSEQEEFYSALAFAREGNVFRVNYEPEHVTVN
jgi:hypothetical protein